MNRLFWGLFFVLLDLKTTVGTAVIEVLPDFIGFYLMMKGMESLAGKSDRFDRGRHWCFGLAIVGGILFGADLMNPDTMAKVWLWAIGLAALILTLVLIRAAVRGIRDMGRNTQNADAMWMILAVMQVICHLLNWVPLVGSVCNGVSMAIGALFLIVLYSTLKKSAE